MYIALRPVNIAGRTYGVGEAVPAGEVLDPPRLIGAGVLCEAPAPPVSSAAEPPVEPPTEPPIEPPAEQEEPEKEPAPKPSKKAKAQKEGAYV